MELKLDGHFSYIDKFNKLKFTYIEDDPNNDPTKIKLIQHCQGNTLPYTDADFTVTLPKMYKTAPTDIQGKVGLDCTLRVKLTPYKFKSKLEHNLGEEILGSTLVLVDIKRN